MKSTTKAKLEHRLQVAFYHDMLVSVLGDADVAFSRIDLGIVYRGPARAEDDALPDEETAQRTAAQKLLGVADALLEVIVAPEDYLCEVREMVTGADSVVNRIAGTKFSNTFSYGHAPAHRRNGRMGERGRRAKGSSGATCQEETIQCSADWQPGQCRGGWRQFALAPGDS